MARSPHRSQSGKGGASGEKEQETNEGKASMVKFKDLTKRLLGVSNKQLREAQEQYEKDKSSSRSRKK